MSKKLINSVKKALDVLDILTFDDLDRQGVPLSELSRRTDIPANTLHGLLTTLAVCGYVRQNPDSSYLAGGKVEDIGKQNLIRHKLAAKIPGLMEDCREKTGESLFFYTLINAEKVPVHSVNSNGLFNINFDQLRQSKFFQVSTSRVIFAFASPESQAAIIARWGMPGDSWNNIQTEEELEQAAASIRKRGFDDDLSHERRIYSIAFPVLDKSGNLFGSIGLYAPISECSKARKALFKKEMMSLANKISDILKS